MDKQMNIFEKMSAITAELKTVEKELVVKAGNGSYKAVSEISVLRAVKPLEAKYGVYGYPCKRQIVSQETLSNNGRNNFFVRVETTYRFVNVENPSEFIEVTTYGDGMDSGDKASGKAQTYSDKYALLKAFQIMTGDDPDQYASDSYWDAPKAKAPGHDTTLANVAKAAYGIDLNKLAIARHRASVDELTDEDLNFAIDAKKKARGE